MFRGNYREFTLRRSAGSTLRATLLPQRPMTHDNSRDTRRRAQTLDLLEGRIREQETAVQRLSRELQKAGETLSFERIKALSSQFAKAQAALDQLMEEWEKTAV